MAQQLVEDFLAAQKNNNKRKRGPGRPKGSRDSKPRKVGPRRQKKADVAAEVLTTQFSPQSPMEGATPPSTGAPYCRDQLFEAVKSVAAHQFLHSPEIKQHIDRALRDDPRKADIFEKLQELRGEVTLLKAVDAKQDEEDKKLVADVKDMKEHWLGALKRKSTNDEQAEKRFASLDARLKSYESRFKAIEDRLLSAELRLPSS
jgi:hypothetical protein